MSIGLLTRFIMALKPYLVVFIASGCILVMEIVAGRILAPVIGVSLYTWTSIIGIVLAGISLGNYLGGRVADWRPQPTTLGIILLAGGVSSLGILPIFAVVSDLFDNVPILPRIVLIVTALFIAPSIILGMVTPGRHKARAEGPAADRQRRRQDIRPLHRRQHPGHLPDRLRAHPVVGHPDRTRRRGARARAARPRLR